MTNLLIKLLFGTFLFACALEAEATNFHTIGTLCPNASSKIGSQVSGRIEEIEIEVGDHVQKGQTLAILDRTLLEIDLNQKVATLESAKIEFDDAETNFQRMKKLWEKPAGEVPSISQKRFEDASMRLQQAAVQITQGQEAVKRAEYALNEASIKAPFQGIITKKFISAGETVATVPSTDIVEIQSIHPLYLEFAIPQSFLNWVTPGTNLAFEVEGGGVAKKEAAIALVYPKVDENTRSVKCRAVIDNGDFKLRPGSLVKVEIVMP